MPPKRIAKAKATTKQTKKPKSASKQKQDPQLPSYAPQNDAEILRAFRLFAIPCAILEADGALDDEDAEEDDGDEDDDGEFAGEGLMKVADVRRCLSALNLPKPPRDFFSPNQKHINALHFTQLARTLRDSASTQAPATKNNLDGAAGTSDSESDYDDDDAAQEQQREIDAAFRLFTKRPATSIATDRITVEDLRRVAQELREDVEEGVLRMMMDEAVGERGGWKGGGVGREDFEEVMRRAGLFG